MKAADSDFFHAVRTAAKAFSRTELANAAKGPARGLIAKLRQMGGPEFEIIADLLAGDLSPAAGRQNLSFKERRDLDLLIFDIRDRKRQLTAAGVRSAIDAQMRAASEYTGDPRANGRSAEYLFRLANFDPYAALIREVRAWIARGVPRQWAVELATRDHRATEKSSETIDSDLGD
jgi:hypothetical protein